MKIYTSLLIKPTSTTSRCGAKHLHTTPAHTYTLPTGVLDLAVVRNQRIGLGPVQPRVLLQTARTPTYTTLPGYPGPDVFLSRPLEGGALDGLGWAEALPIPRKLQRANGKYHK
eukprot:8389087-Pyramimonas_sp.AAC.1